MSAGEPAGGRYRSFSAFYPHYIHEHSNRTCRRIHVVGTGLVIAAFVMAIVTLNAWWLLALPLLWAPVSAAVAIAFFADRSIEYSEAYAAFQIGVARVLFPISQWLGGGDLFGWVWSAFQWVSTLVGFLSALARIWPMLRRLLGPEPVEES